MQRPIYILFVCLLASPISAQNFILNYSGRFQEIIPLHTDSVYTVSGTQTRELAFDYDASNRIITSRYRTTDPAQNFEIRQIFAWTYSPNKFISIDTTVTILPFPNISLSRTTTDSLDGKVVSFLAEGYYNNVWKATQKDTLIYDASNRLIERSSQFWDFVDMVWKYTSFQRLEYDAQGHISIRRELGLGNSITDTTTYNEYIYTYNLDGQITSLISRYGSQPQNYARETYAYDNNGNLDSLNIGYWNTVLQIWRPDYVYVLDDSPEQQATTNGKIYRLNSQSQWYLDSEAFFTPGPQIYTDEPAEILTKKFNANTNQLGNYERLKINYTELPDGSIKGDLQRAFFTSGNWQNAFHVEAWMRKTESVGIKTPDITQPPSCGFPTPLALADLPIFAPEIDAPSQLEIFSTDGRLVLSQHLAKDFPVDIGKNQTSIYWLVLKDETNIICVQKVFLH